MITINDEVFFLTYSINFFSHWYIENLITGLISGSVAAIHRLLTHRTRGDALPRQSLTKQMERTIRRSIMMHPLISSSPLFTSDGWGWHTHGWKELAENPIRISCGLCARTLATSRLPQAVSLSGTRRNVLLALTFDPVWYLSTSQYVTFKVI